LNGYIDNTFEARKIWAILSKHAKMDSGKSYWFP